MAVIVPTNQIWRLPIVTVDLEDLGISIGLSNDVAFYY